MKGKYRRQKRSTDPINWASMPKITIHSCAKPGDWECAKCHALNFACRKNCKFCSSQRSGQPALVKAEINYINEEEVQAGDWWCSECGSVVFAKKYSCFHCHTKRNGAPPILRHQTFDLFPGDRICKRCEVVVFANKHRCFMCNKLV